MVGDVYRALAGRTYTDPVQLLRRTPLVRRVVAALAGLPVVGLPLLVLSLWGPQAATLVVAAFTFVVAGVTLYLHVLDRRPRLTIHAHEERHFRDGRVVARSSEFARRGFLLRNPGTKPVKVEEVRVEFADARRGGFPATGVLLEADTGAVPGPVQPALPGWLDRWQTIRFTADLRPVEQHLHRQGHSGPTVVRLVVVDGLGNLHGRHFEVLARPEEGPRSRMRALLVDELGGRVSDAPPRRGLYVPKGEIEDLGAGLGLGSEASARLFEELERVAWRGEYDGREGQGWSGAWVRYVR